MSDNPQIRENPSPVNSAAVFDPTRRQKPPRDLPYMDRLAGADFQPVFIMGQQRSGTTILYKLLGLSECFNLVSVYHVLCYDQVLADCIEGTTAAAKQQFNDYLAARDLHTRLIDNMAVSADYTEEYGMFLLTRHWRFGVSPGCLRAFDQFCRKVQWTGVADRPLLLKNPPDYSNFPYLHRVYPQAKFVFINRHPIDVLSSQLAAVRKLWTEPSPWVDLFFPGRQRLFRMGWYRRLLAWLVSPDSRLCPVLRLLQRRSRGQRDAVRRRIGALPGESYISLRYEDLCREPERNMSRILDFLGCKPRVAVDYASLIERRPRRWSPDIQRAQERLCAYYGCGLTDGDYTP
jgi:hypothetical protein